MIDRKLIREEPDLVRQGIKNRGSDFDVDELIRLDERRREAVARKATIAASSARR